MGDAGGPEEEVFSSVLHPDLFKGSGALTDSRSRSCSLEHPSAEKKEMLRFTGNLQVKLPAPSVCIARKLLGMGDFWKEGPEKPLVLLIQNYLLNSL